MALGTQSDRMLGPRGGGVGGTQSRAGLPRTLSQEALREVAASLTLMTNVTDNPARRALGTRDTYVLLMRLLSGCGSEQSLKEPAVKQ